MRFRIILAAIVISFFSIGSGLAQTDAPLHTFYGEVKAVDLKAKTLTIKSGGKSFVFFITDETKMSGENKFVRLDTIKRGQGAAVVMRLGEGNKGIAVNIRIDLDASFSQALSLYSARTTRGEMISGIAVFSFVVFEPPAHEFIRGLDFGKPKVRMFRLSVLPDGTVASAIPYESFGYQELDARGEKWLKRWKFRPNSVTEVRIPVVSSQTRR
jgi:hypothetical protein